MANIVDLNGLSVIHSVKDSVKKPFGTGVITEVKEADDAYNSKFSVDFGEEVGVKLFPYPLAFMDYLTFESEVSDELEEMIECDIEEYKAKIERDKEELLKKALVKPAKVKEFAYIALKRPYVDSTYYCSQIQMKNNVNSKFTFCQTCGCKDCILGDYEYDELVADYNDNGGCNEVLISTNYTFYMSKRNKVESKDFILFTTIPKDYKEQDRFVYGCGVVDTVVSADTYNEVYLDPENSYFVDYEDGMSNKFWDVMINLKRPDVMLFGNSHSKKLTDMQAAQYVRMLFENRNLDEEELENKYNSLLTYLGFEEKDIDKNNGVLIRIAEKEKAEDSFDEVDETESDNQVYDYDYEDSDEDED